MLKWIIISTLILVTVIDTLCTCDNVRMYYDLIIVIWVCMRPLLFSQRNFKRPLSSVNLIWIGILKGSEGNINNLLLLVWLLVMLNFFFLSVSSTYRTHGDTDICPNGLSISFYYLYLNHFLLIGQGITQPGWWSCTHHSSTLARWCWASNWSA